MSRLAGVFDEAEAPYDTGTWPLTWYELDSWRFVQRSQADARAIAAAGFSTMPLNPSPLSYRFVARLALPRWHDALCAPAGLGTVEAKGRTGAARREGWGTP